MKKQMRNEIENDYHPSVSDYDDNELFEELRERGYHGTLTKKIILEASDPEDLPIPN